MTGLRIRPRGLAYWPVPDKAIVCGEPTALPVMVTAAVSAPVAVGAKWPWMEQLAPTARVVPQVLAKTVLKRAHRKGLQNVRGSNVQEDAR